MFKYQLLPTIKSPDPLHIEWIDHRKKNIKRGLTFGFALCVLVLLVICSLRSRVSASNGHDLLDDIHNATMGFQRIFVVSQPFRTDRRDKLALAADITGIDVEFVDGVQGEDVPDKALPPYIGQRAGLKQGEIGAWRTHSNILQRIITEHITSALIFEADADWDIRLKDQLTAFAKSTRALTQPLSDGGPDTYADPTFPEVSVPRNKSILPKPIPYHDLPSTVKPTVSPYGDDWSILQPGHCGVQAPIDVHERYAKRAAILPSGFVVQYNDSTVAEPHYMKTHDNNYLPPYRSYDHTNHTRITHHTLHFVCSHAYAVSHDGARRLMNHVGVRGIDRPYDVMMSDFCSHPEFAGSRGPCLTTQPPLFGMHHSAGAVNKDSDIQSVGAGGTSGKGTRLRGYTDMIRLSVKSNIGHLMSGTQLDDSWPDTHEEEVPAPP